jgi:hypothetical protein
VGAAGVSAPSAEAVAREVVDLIIRACYDPLSRRLMRDDAVALATAALTAHATAAVDAERADAASLVWTDAASYLDALPFGCRADAANVAAIAETFRSRAVAVRPAALGAPAAGEEPTT